MTTYSKQKIVVISIFFIFVIPSLMGQNMTPTVYTEAVKKISLYHIINYGGRVSPVNTFPQNANYGGIVRQVSVQVGQRVSIGSPLYSVQQITPGAQFQAGWVYALNSGIIAQVSANPGEQIAAGAAVVTIADISSYRIDFFISARDAQRIKMNDPVYLDLFTRQLAEANQQLKNLELQKADPLEINEQINLIKSINQNRESATGSISLLPLIPDLTNGLFSVRANFKSNDLISVGRFEVLELHVNHYNGLALEQSYVTKRYGKQNVTVVRDGKIEYQEVDIGDNYGSMVSIIGGLKEGDQIVVRSNRRYKLGDDVIVVEQEQNSEDTLGD